MLVRGRVISLGFVVMTAIVSGGSCSSREEATPVPAAPGGQQPPSGGKTLDEVEACKRLRDAEESVRKRLNCEPLNRAECPFYVRPAGTGCWTYDESSVSTCENILDDYQLCSDFTQKPCVLTAKPADGSSCPPLPGSGEGGQAGTTGNGASGEAGAARGGSTSRGGSGGTNGGASGESGNAGAGG